MGLVLGRSGILWSVVRCGGRVVGESKRVENCWSKASISGLVELRVGSSVEGASWAMRSN